jgi:hypothetical protein
MADNEQKISYVQVHVGGEATPKTMMAYEDSAALMQDATFRGRIKVACLEFGSYVMNEAGNAPAHVSRWKWAQNMFQSPEGTAAQLQPAVVMDPNVQQSGAAIDDNTLQSAVEAAIQKFI